MSSESLFCDEAFSGSLERLSVCELPVPPHPVAEGGGASSPPETKRQRGIQENRGLDTLPKVCESMKAGMRTERRPH